MPCSLLRRFVGLAATPAALAALALLTAVVPACSRSVAVTYPGSNVVKVPWRSCGMPCEDAFQELLDSHKADGKECTNLVERADDPGGADSHVAAAALYDAAILLVLQGKDAEATARFTRAEALDPDPDFLVEQQAFEDAARRYLPPGGEAAPLSVSAPAAPPPPAAAR